MPTFFYDYKVETHGKPYTPISEEYVSNLIVLFIVVSNKNERLYCT